MIAPLGELVVPLALALLGLFIACVCALEWPEHFPLWLLWAFPQAGFFGGCALYGLLLRWIL